jgi:signal transduction histidine kinase/HAMP domain-containing protein
MGPDILRRLALGTKMLIAPTVGVVALIAVAVTAYWGLEQQRNTLDNIDSVRFARLQLAMEANAFTQEAQQQLARALAASAGEQNTALEKLANEELLAKVRSAIPTLQFMIDQQGLDESEKKIASAAMLALLDYSRIAKEALERREVEPMTARKLESAFDVLSWNLTKLVSIERELTGVAFAESHRRSRAISLSFLGVIAISLLAALGTTLIVTRHVRAKVEAIRSAAADLSGGNLTRRAEVSSDDEIGQTARAFNYLVDELAQAMSRLQVVNTRLSDEMLAILEASQALSSETDLSELKTRVVDLLATLTDATRVQVISHDPDAASWFLARDGAQGRDALLPVDEAAERKLLSLTAFRQGLLADEPVVVENVKLDERFEHDAYFDAMEHCSLMIIPVLHQGTARAMLVLENDRRAGVFASGRNDVVMLIARQLAISLENVRVYEDLERRVQQRTSELRAAQAALVAAARRAGMAEIATNMLHNVGNVLNSVNVSAGLIRKTVDESKADALNKVVKVLGEHATDIGEYLSADPKGKLIPAYLAQLAPTLADERSRVREDLSRLTRSVEHIIEIVAMQQSYAGNSSGLIESTRLQDLVEDALRMNAESFAREGVTVVKEIADMPPLMLDKHRVLLIMVNLINNAKQAIATTDKQRHEISVKADLDDGPRLRVRVTDNGEGIAPENLTRIFSHGFTTRRDGHGFGLHSCALAAMEMGGKLSVHSDGPGKGATFTLEIPVTSES